MSFLCIFIKLINILYNIRTEDILLIWKNIYTIGYLRLLHYIYNFILDYKKVYGYDFCTTTFVTSLTYMIVNDEEKVVSPCASMVNELQLHISSCYDKDCDKVYGCRIIVRLFFFFFWTETIVDFINVNHVVQ